MLPSEERGLGRAWGGLPICASTSNVMGICVRNHTVQSTSKAGMVRVICCEEREAGREPGCPRFAALRVSSQRCRHSIRASNTCAPNWPHPYSRQTMRKKHPTAGLYLYRFLGCL